MWIGIVPISSCFSLSIWGIWSDKVVWFLWEKTRITCPLCHSDSSDEYWTSQKGICRSGSTNWNGILSWLLLKTLWQFRKKAKQNKKQSIKNKKQNPNKQKQKTKKTTRGIFNIVFRTHKLWSTGISLKIDFQDFISSIKSKTVTEHCATSLSSKHLLCEPQPHKANEEITVSRYIQLKNEHRKWCSCLEKGQYWDSCPQISDAYRYLDSMGRQGCSLILGC